VNKLQADSNVFGGIILAYVDALFRAGFTHDWPKK